MELIVFIQVFNIIIIAIGTLLYMCCRPSSAADSDVADSAADCAAVADDEDADIPPRPEKYDVFISFRGEDTRHGITSHLHAALLLKKIETYIDYRLHKGEEIGPALLEAVEKSTVSVIIFSQNYASSSWCLDEVVHILECKERYGQMVIPVFYDINPSDVRKQHGSYADAFAQLEKRFDNSIDKVHKWREALTTAANLSGFESNKYGTEADLIQKVVDHIWTQLCRESSCDLKGFVGIEGRIKKIESLLSIYSPDACITVGIWGMGGVGKTTLAETVFHRLSSKFEASCFLRNVREREQKDGLEKLQKTLLKEILKEESLSIRSTYVRERLSRTKVLIVLDDVSDSMQLEHLAGDRLLYGTGSRIIITSRDRGTLGQTVEEDNIYEVEVLKPDDALQLFCSRAFKNNSTRRADYEELAKKVVAYAKGVPLALTVLGSLFFNCKSKEEWEDEFNKLKRFPSKSIQKVLRLSYDRLEKNEKEIFLDIAVADCAAVADDEDADIPPRQEKYDVFISFRGEDTRLGITSHLHDALLLKKIETYIDYRLHKGEEIGPALLEAIEKSTISVIIFSQNYASSTWCLDELVHILECKERYGQMVVPIFYDVNPSDVRKQHGSYADAFAQLEKRFDNSIDKVHKWRDALTTAANLSGFDYSNKSGTEAALIKNVVDHIWMQLCRESSCDLEGLVGIESRIQQIEELLGIHSQDARITVGIWGMGGIGKTTLAETVFHKLSSKFDASCFVEDVRENSEKAGGLDHLEKTLLKEILKEEGLSMGSTSVRKRLKRTKVLLVLDDVSDSIQLERLAGKRLRYGTGSRIIITSRDKRTLTEEGKIYEVEGLKRDDALQLFRSRAFKNKSTPITDYKELVEKAVDHAGGIPLALELLGSLFFSCKSKADWEDELDKLKEFPNENLQGVLRVSYDGLERNEKEIFLDIACFHKGNEVKEVRKRLAIRGRSAAAGIRVLVDKSLISIKLIGWEIIEMHDLLEELGRTIVQEQCIEDPGKRNRLFNDEDIYRVLKINKETPNVQAIMFDWSKIKKRLLKSADLKVMSNLKMLIVDSFVASLDLPDSFVASLDLPDSLRYLYWPRYPLESLPSNFSPENLVEIHMRYSQVKKLCKEDQILENIEVIDLKHSWYLTELPNLSEKIVSIDLFGCRSLVEIPWFFQLRDNLTHLDVGGCTSLEYLPEMPKNIIYLDLQNSGIKKLPESVWSHEKISHLDITGCKDLEKLPSNKCKLKVSGCFNLDGCTSLGEFSELPRDISKLSLVGCMRLVSLPANICELKYLEGLNLSGCSKLQNFPQILEPMEHLKYLNLSQTAIEELYSSIEFLPALKTLELQSCKRLSSIPKSICKLKYLEELNLSGCSKLKNFPEILEPMEHLKSLDLSQTAVEKQHLPIEFLPNIMRRSADNQSYYVLGHKTANIRDLYTLGHKLGQGQFGTTYLCTEIATGSQYACKSISKRKLISKEDVDDVRREIQIMHHLAGHKNIVTIKGAYEDSLYVHIVMELCGGGELFDRIIQRGHYSERKAAELTRIIVGVVEACHSLGVMHRDLKPENFLLVNKDNDFSLKAIDFGLSVFFKPGQVFTDVVGSPYYVAPEVLLKHYGPEADVWTAGVILYILLSGVPPFWAETQQGIFDAVLKGYIDFESDPWPLISDSAKDLIRKMLCSRPSDRLTAHEVLCHPWICENGVAPDRALDPAVLSRLKTFSAMNKLKKMALRVIAESLSEEEIAGLREMFQAMDTDNSGAITFDELKAGLRRYGSTMKDTEIRDLMDAADVDNSGTIDYGEFIAATVHLNKLEREEHLVAAFRYFDKDASGYITVDELQQACTEHHMTDVLLEDIIKEVDQDNDGRIDYGEFVAMMQKGNVKGNMPIGRRTMRNSLNLSMRDAPGAL